MEVRAKKRPPQHKIVNGQPTPKEQASSYVFPAPLSGWVLNQNAATPRQATARVLDNFICTTRGIKARGGKTRLATLNAACTSIFTYRSGGEQIFAATGTEVTDISSPGSPTTPEAADITGQTSGDYSAQQFGTTGGNFLYIVNGADDAQLYDGTSWTAINAGSTPAITGVSTSSLSQVWSYANRLFFVEENSLTAHYLPVDQVGGAALSFSLAGVFKEGGSLLFGAAWSVDAGDGLDDKCVFVSTEGEVAVYEGTNPGSASDWRLVGRYDIPKPLGKNAHEPAGGDLMIATEAGLVPISSAITLDVAAQIQRAVSNPISSYWQQKAASLGDGWEVIKIPRENILLVSQPGDVEDTALCVNLQTAAWSRFTGWRTSCMGVYQDRGVFGDEQGRVYYMNLGGSDDGELYTCRYVGSFDALGSYGVTKTALQARYILEAGSPSRPKLTFKADFDLSESTPPASPADYTVDVWDVGQWDSAVWDADTVTENSAKWTSTPATGSFMAPELQMSFNVTPTPSVELVAIDLTYRMGAIAT